jgi:hypothetical protein
MVKVWKSGGWDVGQQKASFLTNWIYDWCLMFQLMDRIFQDEFFRFSTSTDSTWFLLDLFSRIEIYLSKSLFWLARSWVSELPMVLTATAAMPPSQKPVDGCPEIISRGWDIFNENCDLVLCWEGPKKFWRNINTIICVKHLETRSKSKTWNIASLVE